MKRPPQVIDMRLDGSFPQAPRGVPISFKLMVTAIAVAGLASFVAVAALAVWVLSMVVPVAIVAGLMAWATLRFRQWQARRRGSAILRRS